jgi:hypothetical protein
MCKTRFSNKTVTVNPESSKSWREEIAMWQRFLILTACLTLAGIVFSWTRVAVAQTGKLNLTIEDVMTPQELKDTGLFGLTASQRTALNTWLNRYTTAVFKAAGGASSLRGSASSPCRVYPNTGEKESITENGHGKVLILLDGSMWQVMGVDTVDSLLWLPVEDVIVIKAERPVGCYTYTIINTEEGEKVQAQYLGQR